MHDASPDMPLDKVIPERDQPRARSALSPPPRRSGDSAAMTVPLAQDRDRIAEAMSDFVVHRLVSAGRCLEAALELMCDHPGTGEVQEAIGELELAIADIRRGVFNHHQPDPSPGPQPG
jgi:hypothetical protein